MRTLRNRPLLRNVFSSGVTAVLNAGLTALSVRIYLDALGMERYGLWAALMVVVSLIQLSSVGVGPALTTRTAELQREGRFGAVEKTLAATHWVVVGLGLSSVVIGAFAAIPIAHFLGLKDHFLVEGADLVPWVCLLATLALNSQLVSSTLVGTGRADLVALQSSLTKVLQLSFSAALLTKGLGVKALVWGNILAVLVQVLAGEIALRRVCRVAWNPWSPPDFAQLKPVYRLGAGLAISSSFQLGLAPFGKWLLAQSLGLSAVSVYEIGWSASSHVRALASASFHPIVREFAHHKGYPERTRHLLLKSYRTMTLAFTPLFAVVGLALPLVLRIWLGSGFSPELVTPGRIFLLSAWVGMFGIPGYYCLLGEGRALALIISQAWPAAINVTLCGLFWAFLPFSPSLAAMAMCAASLGTSAYCVWAAARAQ